MADISDPHRLSAQVFRLLEDDSQVKRIRTFLDGPLEMPAPLAEAPFQLRDGICPFSSD